jgi:hypothetical protein
MVVAAATRRQGAGTVSRPGCSAAPLHHDRHTCHERRYLVTDPDGSLYDFCSAACLLSFAVYRLRGDVAAERCWVDGAALTTQEKSAWSTGVSPRWRLVDLDLQGTIGEPAPTPR